MKYYTIPQAAKKFGVPLKTLRTWIAKGQMKCTKIGPRATMITEQQFMERIKSGPMGRAGWKKESLKKWDKVCTRS